MSFLICENSTDYLDSIARLRLMDDDFMRIVFKDEDVVRQFLEIILDRKVDIIECHAQYDINNILGRAISIDVLVKDGDNYINIEVQRLIHGQQLYRGSSQVNSYVNHIRLQSISL